MGRWGGGRAVPTTILALLLATGAAAGAQETTHQDPASGGAHPHAAEGTSPHGHGDAGSQGAAEVDPAAEAARQVFEATGRLHDPREVHLWQTRQLTFGGENAEAYWSPDGTELSFQTTRPPYSCDQIFRMKVDG